MTTVVLDLPDELVELMGSSSAAAEKAREALVLSLLREVRISQGKAAELLGISRWEMMQLAAHAEIPSGPETIEELDEELNALRRHRLREQP